MFVYNITELFMGTNNINHEGGSNNGVDNNGVALPMRGAESGNPRASALQSGHENSAKLNNLNNATRGGKNRRGYSKKRRGGSNNNSNIVVTPISPIYQAGMKGEQGPSNQQVNNAKLGNQAHVQSEGDDVTLVKGGKRRRNKSSRKTKKTKRRKLNSAKSRRKKRTTRRKRSTRSRR